jgi:hypothetical protein
MKRGDHVDWTIGCVVGPFLVVGSDGKAKHDKEGHLLLFLPLGREKLLLPDVADRCAAKGVRFSYDYGF